MDNPCSRFDKSFVQKKGLHKTVISVDQLAVRIVVPEDHELQGKMRALEVKVVLSRFCCSLVSICQKSSPHVLAVLFYPVTFLHHLVNCWFI